MRKLKLFFACLLMTFLSIGQMWAVDVTFGWNQWDGVTGNFSGTTKDEVTQTVDGVVVTYTRNGSSLYANSTAIRFYGSNTLKFEAPSNYTISNIEITGSAFKDDVTTNVATCTSTTSALSWEGDASSVTFTRPGTSYITMTGATVTLKSSTPADPHTVSFSTGVGNPAVSPIPETTAGQGISLPAGPTPACSANGWSFAGWAATAVASETTTAPTLLAAGTNYKPAEDVTLYAVYKRTEGGDGAAVNTVMWSENFTGVANKTTPASPSENGSEVYGSATITYTWTNGGTTTNVLNDNQGPHTDANNPNVLVSKINGSLQVSGIPVGKASTLSVEYAKSGQGTLSVSTSTTDVSIDGGTVTIENANVTAFDLTFENTHASKNLRLDDIVVKIASTSAAGTTTYLSAPSCCEKHAITIATGIENGSVEADLAEACEGTAVTLTFTPATNYHLSGWTLNGEAQDVNVNTFSMPAGAATVSATFAQDACDPLATPVVAVSGKAYPYNAVKLAWSAITNADSYKVYIYDAEDNELEHDDAFTGVEYTIGKTLSASTTYKYSVQAISNTPAQFCPSTEAASTFVTDALPKAHLTLMALGDEHASSGDYTILTPFNLPATAASCAKAFVGWDEDPDCVTAPHYAKGAEFTFANTTGVTLYAVYADETPGAATLTKLGNGATFADGDKLVIAAKGTNFGLYFENAGSSYIKNWEFEGDDPVLSELADAKKILTLEKSGDNWKFGDATNGYFYSSSSNNLEISTTNSSEFNSFVWNNTEAAFTITKTDNRYLNCRTDLTSSNANLWRFNGTNTNSGSPFLYVYKYATSASTYDNYSTSCIAAPTAEPASNPLEVAAAAGNGTLNVTYENVNLEGVTVALCDDNQGAAFTGDWLSASIAGDDKHIEYTVQANNSYNDARTAYIQLTAPETNNAATPAVVYIEVTQAKKAAVFGNLADLVAANVNTGTQVTVTFEEIITNDQFISQGSKRAGVMLTTTAGDQNKTIEIFYNKGTTVVPAEWVIGGKLAATSMTFTWTLFTGDQWELVPLGNDWTWDNGDLTYTAPKTVSSVVVSGAPSKTEYVDGEKFAPAGLTVTVNYSDATSEVNPVGVTFACDPERVAKSDDPVSVNVVATFNEVSSEAFQVNVTVGDIQLKTTQEFIAAGNADMRCYLEGIVSNITNTTYGNFDLTDASGKIYVYGCLNQAGEAQKFNELGVANGDKIKVIAEDYDYYNKHEAKNVVFVSKKSPATMTFDDLALEFGDVETMAPATITLADASDIEYSIKDGSDDCVTIAGDQITAKSVAGTATIVATLDETPEYVGATVEFVVTVTAPITKYAISFDGNGADGGNAPEAIADQAENAEVTLPANTYTLTGNKFDGWKVINNTTSAEVPVAAGKFSMPASAVTIQAQWAPISAWAYVYDNNVKTAYTGSGAVGTITISDKAYRLVKAGSKNNTGTIKVTVPAGATDLHFHAFAWGGQTATVEISGVTNPSVSEFALAGEIGAAGSGNDFTLQGVPVDQYFHVSFDAVAEETEIVFSKATSSADNRFFLYGVNQEGGDFGSYQRSTTSGNYGTICLPYAGTISGATLFEIADYENDMIYCDEIIDGKMIAGRPYIFYATSGSLNVAYTSGVAAAYGSHNGLYGFYNLENENAQYDIPEDAGNYILYQNAYWLVKDRAAYIANYRAYIKIGQINNTGNQAPGRRRVAMTVHGEQVATGVDALNAAEAPVKMIIDGQLFILRGEKMYDATGRLVK